MYIKCEFHHTTHLSFGFIVEPTLQLNALANSSKLELATLTLKQKVLKSIKNVHSHHKEPKGYTQHALFERASEL